jgi:hypothetical protein
MSKYRAAQLLLVLGRHPLTLCPPTQCVLPTQCVPYTVCPLHRPSVCVHYLSSNTLCVRCQCWQHNAILKLPIWQDLSAELARNCQKSFSLSWPDNTECSGGQNTPRLCVSSYVSMQSRVANEHWVAQLTVNWGQPLRTTCDFNCSALNISNSINATVCVCVNNFKIPYIFAIQQQQQHL